eukprot:g38814.t1
MKLQFGYLRAFVLNDVQSLLASSRSWGLHKSSKTQKADKSYVTLLDVLVQYLTCVQLQNHFPGERLIAEEDLDFTKLRAGVKEHSQLEERFGSILQQAGDSPLRVCFPKIKQKEQETSTRVALEVSRAPVWILDPIDGTKDFAQGGNEFCYSLARMEPHAGSAGNVEVVWWLPTYAIISAPVFPGLSSAGIPPCPTLELQDFAVSLYSRPLLSPSSSSSTSSSSTSPNPVPLTGPIILKHPMYCALRDSYQKPGVTHVQTTMKAFYPEGPIINTKSCPSVMQLLQASFGVVSVFHNPRMSLWDHAAGLGIVHALGGAALREDGSEWIGYTAKDLTSALCDQKFPLTVSGSRAFLMELRGKLYPQRITAKL